MNVNVSAIVKHKNKILLMQRDINDKHFPGHWGVPGGGMEEEDDSLESTAIREVAEEMGLKIKPLQIRYNNRYKDVIFIVLVAELTESIKFNEKLLTSDEVYNYEWVGLGDIEDKEFTPFTKERVVEILNEISANQ
ncbi:MAG: NUDIX domain-containing protein [bacterium]|jgi:8-oxo-dGTP pyrophosphatase MutT (NUDIX family)